MRIDHETRIPISGSLLAEALCTAGKHLGEAAVMVLSDYSKGFLTGAFCAQVIEEGRRRGMPIVVDPKSQDFARYAGCTVITPNLGEASRASGIVIDSEETLTAAGERLSAALPGTSILITRGASGMTLFENNRPPFTVPAVARQVYDVVGAGDTVVAMLAMSLGAGIGLPEAMHLANTAAGIVVDKPGTATTTMAEILRHEGIADFPAFAVAAAG